jgi:hypothetical protein
LGPRLESVWGTWTSVRGLGLSLYHGARDGTHDPVAHGPKKCSLEGLCHDVCDHEFGGAIDQLDDFLDNDVVDPEVPDSDMSCKFCRSPVLHQFDGRLVVLEDSDRCGRVALSFDKELAP